MAKTIKDQYDEDPSAGNDPATSYLVPSDDGADTPICLDIDQLAAAIAVRLGIDPLEPVENFNQLVITIQDNTLNANIQTITGLTYTHYAILSDDDTEPTYPGDFTQGQVPQLYTLSSYTAEILYVWVYNLPTATPNEVLTPAGGSGITVVPNDTTIPVGILTLTADGSNPETEIDWSIAATDAHSEIDTTLTTLTDSATGIDISIGAASGTIVGLNPNTEYTYQGEVYDNFGNMGIVGSKSHTTDANTGEQPGSIEFTETGNPAYTVAEDVGGGVLAVSLTLTGRTDSDEKYCTVSSRSWTTEGTSQVTAWSTETITFATDADPKTVTENLVLDNESLSANNMVEVYIDDGSAAGDGESAPAVGQRNAILIKITGSGSTATTGYQDYTDSGDQIVVLDSDMDWVLTPGGTHDFEKATMPSADGGSGPTDGIHHDGTGAPNYVNINPITAGSSTASLPITLSKAGPWYIWARMSATGSNYTTHFMFDKNWVEEGQFARWLTGGATWQNRPVGGYTSAVPVGYSAAAGDHTIDVAAREHATSLWFDQIIISDSPDDLTAEAYNTTLSTKGSSEPAIDNPDNPDNPMGPPTTSTVTPTYSPADAATNVQTNVDLIMDFPGLSGLIMDFNQLTVTTNGGGASGQWYMISTNRAAFKLNAGQSWISGAAIEVIGSDIGSIVEDGSRKSLDDIGAGDWLCTAVDNDPTTDYIQFVDMEGITGVPRPATNDDIRTLFHTEGWDGFWNIPAGNYTNFVNDPDGSRGVVMEHFIQQGTADERVMQTRHYDIVDPDGGGVMQAVYAAVDMRVQPGYLAPASVHLGGIWTSPDRSTHGGTTPDDITPDKCATGPNFYGSQSGYNVYPNSLGIYAYHHNYGSGNGWYGPMLLNRDNPSTAWQSLFSLPGQMTIPIGRWFTFEWYMKLNTFSGSTPNEDGEVKAWVDGELGLDATGVRLLMEDAPTLGINMITHGAWYGGAGAIAIQDDTIWRDNFRYATFAISH